VVRNLIGSFVERAIPFTALQTPGREAKGEEGAKKPSGAFRWGELKGRGRRDVGVKTSGYTS